ncbi:MAG: hypothetical protein J7K40_11630 [candidate division Zixibacteria bacterium]|nr:hypothetical protein [candidate division Zixibacteria bacterium]
MKFIQFNPESKLSALPVEVKLAWILCLSIWILVVDLATSQLLLLILMAVLAFCGGLKISAIMHQFYLFLPVFIIVFLFHLFYHPGDELFHLWVLTATDTGLKAGIFNIFRFINFIIMAVCILSFISPEEFAVKLSTGFGIVRHRFFQELALVFFIALRFLPVQAREREIVRMAMNARGANLKGGYINRLKMESKLLLPLFARTIKQSDDVAAAIALKGHDGVYFAGVKSSLKGIDYCFIFVGLSITILILLI